jgi:hypothetical protein
VVPAVACERDRDEVPRVPQVPAVAGHMLPVDRVVKVDGALPAPADTARPFAWFLLSHS